jgi:Uncharacterized conserved protein (DUF2203)
VRYWTVEEASAYLPRLRLLLGVIRRAAHLVVSAKGNGHATLPGAPAPSGPKPAGRAPDSGSSGPPSAESERAANGEGASGEVSGGEGSEREVEPPVTFDVKEALAELEEQGIVLRDPDRGLIDFRALHSGREVLLCWQLGEEGLEWWHLPEDGFAGRRPLPLPPEL